MIDNPGHYALIFADASSGGKVFFHPAQNKLEQAHNKKVGIFLAQNGYIVWLLPPSNRPNSKTPDAWLEKQNIMIEFKHCQTPTKSAIELAIKKAKKQANYILLDIDCSITNELLVSGVENRCQRQENKNEITEIWIVLNNELLKFGFDTIIQKTWREALEIKQGKIV